MNKVFYLWSMLLALFVFTGCGDDEEGDNSSQTVMINLYWKYENIDDTKIASPSIVALYDYEDAKNFDKEASVNAMANDGHIVLKDGTALTPKYISNNTVGVNIFENVANGKYMVIAMYKPDGYSFPFAFLYGYKMIEVNSLNGSSLNTFIMIWENSGKFVEMNKK